MALSDAAPFAVAAWTLDETSSTRVDQVGANDLAEVNGVASTTGKFSNAALFDSTSSEALTIADNTDLSAGDIKFLLRAWVSIENKDVSRAIIGKYGGSSFEYTLYYFVTSNRFVFEVNGTTFVTANNFGSPSLNTAYLVHAWHDPDANQIGISVNAGMADTASFSAGINDSNGAFDIGRMSSGLGFYWDGWIDDVVVLKGYLLDATERTADYNSGTGVAFADWAGAGAAGHPASRRFGVARSGLWLPTHRPVEIGRQGALVF
jgi:hypothetical protein